MYTCEFGYDGPYSSGYRIPGANTVVSARPIPEAGSRSPGGR